MPFVPIPDDPILSVVRAAAQASLQTLHEELGAARRSLAQASAAIPSTTLDWFGPSSEALRTGLERLDANVDDARGDLDAALALVQTVLP